MADDEARDAERDAPDQGAPLEVGHSRRGAYLEKAQRLRRFRPARRGTPPDGDGGEDRERGRIRAFLTVVADRVWAQAPRIPVRDLETLRRQFPGLGPDEIADRLIRGATRSSASVGASIGAAAMLPAPPAMPAELAAEIVGVASIELKLVAELHEVYGHRPPGNLSQRTTAYVSSWTSERGIDVRKPVSVNAALGGQMKRELRQQLLKRTARNLPNIAPFMIGAAVGAVMNHRDTKKLAEKIRGDLSKRRIPWDQLPPLPPLDSTTSEPGPPPLPPG